MKPNFRCEYISWSRFYRLSRKLCNRINDSGFKPDIIIAIGRGGYMPARIISDFLQVMNLTSFKIEHYRGTKKKEEPVVRYPLSEGVAGNRVLLVDDVCDTGDTFELANRHLCERMQPEEVRTSVLHFKKTSSFIPDYYAGRIVKWRWIIYPWAAAEDTSEFIKQMHPKPGTIEEIREILVQDYGARIPLKVLRDVLEMLN
ncbi:MAG: phosphoribosyltransferase [Deltaproteobacteria bacterium]|nr:MAG: phosphoribosyltransferase [Deltaproteobacteria bacterium]